MPQLNALITEPSVVQLVVYFVLGVASFNNSCMNKKHHFYAKKILFSLFLLYLPNIIRKCTLKNVLMDALFKRSFFSFINYAITLADFFSIYFSPKKKKSINILIDRENVKSIFNTLYVTNCLH